LLSSSSSSHEGDDALILASHNNYTIVDEQHCHHKNIDAAAGIHISCNSDDTIESSLNRILLHTITNIESIKN